MSPQDRFWSKVNKTQGCWLWSAGTYGDGYGCFYLNKASRAHRISYAWANGAIPEGLVIDHICRTKLCVRPSHLRAVTQRQNLLHGPTIIVAEIARTECREGHPLSGDNLKVNPRGHRECMTCSRARWRRYEDKGSRVRIAREPKP